MRFTVRLKVHGRSFLKNIICQIIWTSEERKVPTKYLFGFAYKFRWILLGLERIILYPASFTSRCLFILISSLEEQPQKLTFWQGIIQYFQYECKIFRKTNISYLLKRTRMWAYQEVRNISFPRNFAYVLYRLSPIWPVLLTGPWETKIKHQFVWDLFSSQQSLAVGTT